MAKIHHPHPPNSRARERLKMATVRLRAYLWEEGNDEPLEGFAFVADFSEAGIGVYLDRSLHITKYARVAFESKEAVSFRARTAWCHRFSLEQKFMGHAGLQYRAGLQFLFGSEEERRRYEDYLKEIKTRVRVMIGEK